MTLSSFLIKASFSSSDEESLRIAQKVLSQEANALKELEQAFSHPEIQKAFLEGINLIHECRGRVVVTGVGKSGHIARKIAATLASTGQPAFFVHPTEANHGDMGMIASRDMVLALSASGETAELSPLMDYTRRLSIPLLSITQNPSGTLARCSTVVFLIPSLGEACTLGLAPTISTTLMLALGDALAVALSNRRSFSKSDFKRFHPGGHLGASLQKVSDKMHRRLPLAPLGTVMAEGVVSMSQRGFGCLGIIDPQTEHLVGIITDGDLRRHMNPLLLTQRVEEVMTPCPTTIDSEEWLAEALHMMKERKITALFVTDRQRPIGLLHIHDLFQEET